MYQNCVCLGTIIFSASIEMDEAMKNKLTCFTHIYRVSQLKRAPIRLSILGLGYHSKYLSPFFLPWKLNEGIGQNGSFIPWNKRTNESERLSNKKSNNYPFDPLLVSLEKKVGSCISFWSSKQEMKGALNYKNGYNITLKILC